MSGKKIIVTDKAPEAAGPYSQAVVAGGLCFVSGQLGLVPETKDFAGQTAAEQTNQAMRNVAAILEKAGLGLDAVLKCTIIVSDIGDFASVNEAYKSFFAGDCPARAAFQSGGLPLGALVEIEAIALAGNE